MKREIKFSPRPSDGESSLELWFQVIGELGVTEFHIITNWFTDGIVNSRVQEMKKDVYRQKQDFLLKHFYLCPFPADVCYFSPVRKSEDDCYWEGGSHHHAPHIAPCYYGYRYQDEGDKWTTDYVYEKLLREGNDGVWNFLESYYVEVFGELR